MDEKDKYFVIKCPNCGYEYLAAEIFFTDSLLGSPKDILRDDTGKILFISGDEPCLEQEWECDKCGHNFTAKLIVKSEVKYDSKYDFGDDYTINLKDEDKQELF